MRHSRSYRVISEFHFCIFAVLLFHISLPGKTEKSAKPITSRLCGYKKDHAIDCLNKQFILRGVFQYTSPFSLLVLCFYLTIKRSFYQVLLHSRFLNFCEWQFIMYFPQDPLFQRHYFLISAHKPNQNFIARPYRDFLNDSHGQRIVIFLDLQVSS